MIGSEALWSSTTASCLSDSGFLAFIHTRGAASDVIAGGENVSTAPGSAGRTGTISLLQSRHSELRGEVLHHRLVQG